MGTLRWGLVIVAAAAALGSCGSPPPTATPPAPAGASSASPASASSEPTTSSATQQSDLTKPFGSTFTWSDGVAVTVSKPAPYKPSSPDLVKMIDPTSKSFVVMDVTLKNGSQKPIDAIATNLKATTGSREAKAFFDSANGVELPTSKVLPGAELKWKAAFGVDEGAPFVVTVSYGFGNPDGIYKD